LVTRNEFEALVLENNLIKEHQPRYNINLKDGKTYPVIRITKDEYPRIFRTRKIIQDGSQYFGPYPDVNAIGQYLELVDNLYPLRKCKGPLKKRKHPCLYYHIKRCAGPCSDLISKEDYGKRVTNIARLLKRGSKSIEKELEKEMKKASENLAFEEAAKLRDSLQSFRTLQTKQEVMDFDEHSRDFVAIEERNGTSCFVVFKMRTGKLIQSEAIFSKAAGEVDELLEQFILQYYQNNQTIPRSLIVNFPLEQGSVIEFINSKRADKKKPLQDLDPQQLEEIRLPEGKREESIIAMTVENARMSLVRHLREESNKESVEELKLVLSLQTLPRRIEGYDIAQLHGKHTVAAMVSFYDGLPDKGKYRYFKIRSLEGGIDDYQSIREAVARRYTKIINEKTELPDLILIDGGKGQVHAAKSILDALGLEHIPLVGLAKKDEIIFRPNDSEGLDLPEGTPALQLLQAVRDEAHRFGTGLNQRLRSKDIVLSELEDIEGIGPKRSSQLITIFESIDNIRSASVDELMEKGKLPEKLAKLVFDHFHNILPKSETEINTENDSENSSNDPSFEMAAEKSNKYDGSDSKE
jgi:excinuclease ABC subunit C